MISSALIARPRRIHSFLMFASSFQAKDILIGLYNVDCRRRPLQRRFSSLAVGTERHLIRLEGCVLYTAFLPFLRHAHGVAVSINDDLFLAGKTHLPFPTGNPIRVHVVPSGPTTPPTTPRCWIATETLEDPAGGEPTRSALALRCDETDPEAARKQSLDISAEVAPRSEVAPSTLRSQPPSPPPLVVVRR